MQTGGEVMKILRFELEWAGGLRKGNGNSLKKRWKRRGLKELT